MESLVIVSILVGSWGVPLEIAYEVEGKEVEKELLLGVMEVESGFDPMKKNKKTGCWGLMQINPKVWKVKNNSIKENILKGSQILKIYLQKTQFSLKTALIFYTNSDRMAEKIIKAANKWKVELQKFEIPDR